MKKRRLKKKPIIILAAVLILFIILIISCSGKKEEKVEVVEKQTSFIKNFNNATNEVVDEKLKNTIIDFFDIYYLSMKELNEYNVSYLFSDKLEAYLTQETYNYLVNYRLVQRNDLRLNDCSYSLKVTKFTKNDDVYSLTILEDGTFNFAFMKDTTSRTYGVENTFEFKKENDEYLITKYRKNADFYNIIFNNLGEDYDLENITNVTNEAITIAKSSADNDKSYYENIKTAPTKKCDHSYDREKAVEYALTWITTRNPAYGNYDNYGGNCQNYASQVIKSGGIPNDVKGFYRFKYYSTIPDETDASVGRTPSWAGVNQFYTYAKYNTNASGLCSLVDINYYYGEKGDLLQFGYKEDYAHTSVVTDVIKENGVIVDLLTSSNTTDRENYPLSAYNYPSKRLIKIYGWND